LDLPKVEVRLGYGMAAAVPPQDGQGQVAALQTSQTGASEGE
jgi:hypothetical protein